MMQMSLASLFILVHDRQFAGVHYHDTRYEKLMRADGCYNNN